MANNYDIPLNNSPTWPSLYWPFDNANYLYQANGLWTWIVFRKYRWSFLIPIGFVIIALLTGFINSVIIGAYNIGELPMSVWIPFLWGLIQAFLLLI
ncbi:8923_t:CDS:2, partial [Gigaspora rosea]